MKTYSDSTLKGMKKDDLIAIIRCLEHNVSVEEERNQNQFNLLMQEDLRKAKYRWHDLRKNPEDLPNNTRTVIIAYEGFEGKSGYKYYDVAFLGAGDLWYSAEVYNFEYHDEGFLVLAWREVEPFKGVEHENE